MNYNVEKNLVYGKHHLNKLTYDKKKLTYLRII